MGKGPDLSSASWASQGKKQGPRRLQSPPAPPQAPRCTPALRGAGAQPWQQERRKVPTGFFLLSPKGLQVFVPETHE